MAGVEGGDDALAWELPEDLGPGGGAEDDLAGSCIEPVDRGLNVADAAADAAWVLSAYFLEQISFEPVPMAASRSMRAISPTRANFSAMGRGSPASMAFFSPPMSCTA
jgi:hypothetical protein